MAMEEFKRSLYFMLNIVAAYSKGDTFFAEVAEKEVATEEEAQVDVEVVASGGQNPIFLTDHTLTRNGRFLATMRRERNFLSEIKLNRARSMRSRYWNCQ